VTIECGLIAEFVPALPLTSSSRDPEAKPTFVGGVAGFTPLLESAEGVDPGAKRRDDDRYRTT
jgi:hypothetical protein